MLAGRRCPTQAQLQAFREQVANFVANGALTPSDAAPLLDGVGQVLHSVIAFSSRRDGNYEIYTMKLDGSGLTRLTDNLRVDAEPDRSPDGRRIVFVSTPDGVIEDGVLLHAGLYVMNADGSGVTRIYFDETFHDVWPTGPRWSPDGSRIVFTSGRYLQQNTLYTVKPDGTGLSALTPALSTHAHPDWSPDGTRIAFTLGHPPADQLSGSPVERGWDRIQADHRNRFPQWLASLVTGWQPHRFRFTPRRERRSLRHEHRRHWSDEPDATRRE